MEKIVWETNVPQELVLKFPTGKSVKSLIDGAEQFLFSTVDDRVMFLHPEVAAKIHALQLRVGEPFRMCRREVRNQAGKARMEWQVERIEGEEPVSRPATPIAARELHRENGSSHNQNTVPTKVPMDQAMERFLLAAGRATKEAERILGAEGGSVRFDNRDVAAIATSMFIHASKAGWLTWLDEPQTLALLPATSREARESAVRVQQQVAERKIENLEVERKAAQRAPVFGKVDTPWHTKAEQDRAFAAIRQAVGETTWADELARLGVRGPGEVRYWNDKENFYNRLVDLANVEGVA